LLKVPCPLKVIDDVHQIAQFQQMLKDPQSVKLESQAAKKLKELLGKVPTIQITNVHLPAQANNPDFDFILDLETGTSRHQLICEVKANGQPRNVRMALLQLRNYVVHFGGDALPMLVAPYLSPEAQSLCREANTGYLDFEGNARLVFDGVFVERSVPNKPAVERRELRSLFKPKSAQVLIALLNDPSRTWRVTELAAAAAVSLGHVSNVRTGLLDREWGRVSEEGLSLSDPDALLDAWRDAYRAPAGRRAAFYSTLHGAALENSVRSVLADKSAPGHAALASFSAARWLAPYARSATEYFYADEIGLRRLTDALNLTSPAKGENVIVTLPKDPGVFRNTVEPAPGALCTGVVQTYLDLTLAGERGREAAAHLRQEKLTWRK
jgi:hypothetical protein